MNTKESFECDVVIVGAGLSGLSAAYYLSKKDKSLRIAVLEAKDRIGGRTLTRQLTAGDGSQDFWDIGGEWVGRPQPHMQYLLEKFGVDGFKSVSPTNGRETSGFPRLSWQVNLDLWQFIWKLKRLQKRVATIDSQNAKFATELDGIDLHTYLNENLWTSDAKVVIDAASHCMFGLNPKELTLLFFLKNVESAGGLDSLAHAQEFSGAEFRVKGGTQQLSFHLVNKIGKQHVYVSQPVTQIIQSIEGARVMTLKGMHILCQRVILAIPPHQAASIGYQPPLPPLRLELLQRIPLAYIIKFTITYETSFWRKGKAQQRRGFQAVLTDPQIGPVGLVYDAPASRGNPALAGFISHADKMDPEPKNRRSLILSLVEQVVGTQCQKHLDFCQMDWSLEPYNGGCFLKNFIPETFQHFNDDIRQPFDRIHFSGTETATVWCGFMNGAVQAGFRAASEVLYHLRPLIPASPYPDKELEAGGKSTTPGRGSKAWLGWLALGAGVVSVAYVLVKNDRMAESGETFVRNIRLVFNP